MTKKLFAVIIAFLSIVFASSIIFAEDNNTAGGEWTDSVNKTENTMHNIGNGIESAISGVVDTGRNMMNGMSNNSMNNNSSDGMATGRTSNNNNTTMGMTGTNNGNGYMATRTSTGTSVNLFGLSNTAWTWIVMIIATAVIVSLIYYYGSQFENRTNVYDRERD